MGYPINSSKAKTLAVTIVLLLIVFGMAPPTMAEQRHSPLAVGNDFAIDLYAGLSSAPGNLFFSPASIQIAMAMAYAGAEGHTASQMTRVLHLGAKDQAQQAHADFASLIKALTTPRNITVYEQVGDGMQRVEKPAYELVIANALWGQQDYPWNPDFLDLVATRYASGLHEVDFSGHPENARSAINGWVERQTRERIKDLIAPGGISPLMRLIITNAIYFKAAWASEFSDHATKPLPFYPSPDKVVETLMMHQKSRFRYMETETFKLLEMPYKAKALSLLVFLPKTVDGLVEFEKHLTVQTLTTWIEHLSREEVDVYLPKFEFTSRFNLSDTLRAMGMADAFSHRSADFSGMTSAERIWISDVIHKAFIAVDEKGTTAAAATAVMMAGTAMPMPEPEPKTFRADHPFLFCIRHNASGKMLFMGRFTAPESH